jgi:hypothetical protein
MANPETAAEGKDERTMATYTAWGRQGRADTLVAGAGQRLQSVRIQGERESSPKFGDFLREALAKRRPLDS